MHSAQNALRTLWSGDKRRYTAEGFNLDLTYITPRLIAMGIPGKGLSNLWRNSVDEVGKFLDTKHTGHYRIFNLGKSTTNYFRLQQNSVWYGWPANRSPPLELLYRLVYAIDEYLQQDDRNVAVIHCKEGRERSGVVIATYLMKSKVFTNHKDALEYYAQMRSKTREGVSTPSQLRYVEYMASLITHESANVNFPKFLDNAPRKLYIRKMIMRPVPDYSGGVTPIVEIVNSSRVPSESVLVLKDLKTFNKIDFQIPIELNIALQGDVSIRVANKVNVLGLHPALTMFRISFHTSFVPLRWTVTRNDLDAGELSGPVNDNHLRMGFTVEFIFTENPQDLIPDDSNLPLPVNTNQFSNQYQVPNQIPTQMPPQPQVQQQNVRTEQLPLPPYPVDNYNSMNSQQSFASDFSNSNYNGSNNSMYIPTDSFVNNNNSMNPSMSSYYQPMQGVSINNSQLPPPPVNRDTKENRQQLSNATDAVSKATDKLLQSVSTMNIPKMEPQQQSNYNNVDNLYPESKTQM